MDRVHLMAAISEEEGNGPSRDYAITIPNGGTGSSSSSEDDIRPFPAVDSTDQLLMLEEEAKVRIEDPGRPPRVRRKKQVAVEDELGLPEKPEEVEQTEAIIERIRASDNRAESQPDDTAIEMTEIPSNTNRKSVRWTDDFEGGELTQIHQALSYNRKDLSYAPKSRVKVGIWSPFQKKVMIGLGIVLLIILIVLFVVVFTVVKPGSSKGSPEAPTASPTPPFGRGPTAGPPA